jgi:vitamin B12 transporter
LKTLFILLFQIPGLLAARAGSSDSVYVFHVKEIQVTASRFDYFTEGQQAITLSPQILNIYRSNSVGELLGIDGQAYIKSYGGAGSLSTISIRGANSNQTQVNWNGFPLNSITTGDADLSLIPIQLMDELNIYPGASGSLYGSGTFGGSVDILNKAKNSSPLSIFLNSEIGSYHSHYLSGGFSQGIHKLAYDFSFVLKNVLNDFTYPDIYKPGSPESLMSHNSLKYMGVFQNLFYNPDAHNTLELGIWYQQKDKELPQIMGAYGPSSASQKDSSFKIFARWTRIFAHSSLTIKSAYFTDYLHYLDKISPSDETYTVDSRIFARQLFSDISYRNCFSNLFSGEMGIVSKLINADVAAYSHGIFEPDISFYTATKFSAKAFSINLCLRTEMTADKQAKPVVAIGTNYSIIKDFLTLRVSSSTKYRLPSLNEKYWQPGGNPNILPEEGWTNEGGFLFKIIKNSASDLAFETQAYSSRMKNLIEWTGSGNNLSAVNFKSVWSRGIDGRVKYTYSGPIIKLETCLGMDHLKSTNTSVYEGNDALLGKQLRYTPQNRINFTNQLTYSIYNFGYIFSYTGKTFVNEDNSGMELPPYEISNIYISAGKQIFGNDCQLTFRISNLFNEHYQVMAAYPEPGRAFYLGISIHLNVVKKNKE